MLFTKAAFCISSLILLASAQEPEAAFRGLTGPGSGRSRTPHSTSSKLMSRRDLNKRCTGSCEECFGDGYTLCPGSSIYCYLPGDDYYGLDSCSSDSYDSSPTTSADSSAPTSSSTSGIDELCYETGATCTSCFGPTYLECPDGYHCYDPADSLYDTCPDDDTTTSSGDNATTVSSCEELWGAGNIPCGSDSCYNPDIGESCCAEGYYCDAGYTCSSIVGKCCAPGSTSSSCSSDSDSGGLLSSSYDSGYTTSSASFATSTNGLIFTTDSATATTSSRASSATGVSQIGDTNGAGVLGIGRGLLVAAGVGALVL